MAEPRYDGRLDWRDYPDTPRFATAQHSVGCVFVDVDAADSRIVYLTVVPQAEVERQCLAAKLAAEKAATPKKRRRKRVAAEPAKRRQA